MAKRRTIKAANNNQKKDRRGRGGLQDAIQEALAYDAAQELRGEVDPMQDDIPPEQQAIQGIYPPAGVDREQEAILLGPPGPPADRDFGSPIMEGEMPIVDHLGRIIDGAGKIIRKSNGDPVYPYEQGAKQEVTLCEIPEENVPLLSALPPTIRQGTHNVTVMRDSDLVFPQLYIRVFLTGNIGEKAQLAQLFVRTGSKKANSPEEADLVVFSGGSDIDPRLYGAEKHFLTDEPNVERDNEYMALYLRCLEQGIPMMGICGGMQFLHAMNGGKLYQHVDGHMGPHLAWDCVERKPLLKISSNHHQMCMENTAGGMEVLLTARKSRKRSIGPGADEVDGNHADIEAFFYRDTCCFGVQGHPEYTGYHHFAKWTMDKINELIVCNPDLDWTDNNVRRLKSEHIDMREAVLAEDNSPASIINVASELEARKASRKGK